MTCLLVVLRDKSCGSKNFMSQNLNCYTSLKRLVHLLVARAAACARHTMAGRRGATLRCLFDGAVSDPHSKRIEDSPRFKIAGGCAPGAARGVQCNTLCERQPSQLPCNFEHAHRDILVKQSITQLLY